jgi:nucleoid DNA-binding protein
MNKKDLAALLAEKQGLKKSQVLDLLNDLVDVVEEELSQGREVRYSGLGRFFTKERATSKGRNPQTGESIQLDSRHVPRFQASERLKRSVRNEK